VFEELTERLEESVENNEHYAAMVRKVYGELMILGFISFFVVLSNVRQPCHACRYICVPALQREGRLTPACTPHRSSASGKTTTI
jgi:hypothetical protein